MHLSRNGTVDLKSKDGGQFYISKTKPNFSLCSLYYAEACNEFALFIFATWQPRQHSYTVGRCLSGGEPFATLS